MKEDVRMEAEEVIKYHIWHEKFPGQEFKHEFPDWTSPSQMPNKWRDINQDM